VRLIPPTIDPDTNRGERLVFEMLERADAAEGWTVLHSLDIADHNRQVAGEIDFLVIVPGSGVLVLEVKGVRRIARHEGVWVYGDGPDARSDRRGPFKQASTAMHSLRERLVRSRPHLAGVPFWSAVCFPLLDFGESSEEWHSWQVIDRRALAARSPTELLAGVLQNGRRRMQERRVAGFEPAGGEPTPAQCEEIVAAVRPDFELFESPRSRARRIEEEIRRFTEEQFAALDSMARNPRVVFDGPAGTGKTLLAMEAARRGAAAGRRVLFVCFNLPLRLWLADRLAELRPLGMVDRLAIAVGGACALPVDGQQACDGSGPGVIVRSLHEQMLHVAGIQPEGRRLDSPFWLETLPELASEHLLEQQARLEAAAGAGSQDGSSTSGAGTSGRSGPAPEGGPPAGGREDRTPADIAARLAPDVFDEVVIDEAQDILRRSYLDFLDLSLRGGVDRGRWRIFGDFEFQRIYREHGSMTLDDLDPDGRWPVCELRVNCRNTPSVTQLACACVGVDPTYCRVLRPDEGEPPQIRGWHDGDGQMEVLSRCLEELRAEGYLWRDIAVLSTVADERSACALLPRHWDDRLERVVQYAPGLDLAAAGAALEHPSGRVRCATIHRFKGLEARAVVITDVTTLDETSRALLHVGATRSVERLIVLARKDVARELRRLAAVSRPEHTGSMEAAHGQ
jgi:hypothetical protein